MNFHLIVHVLCTQYMHYEMEIHPTFSVTSLTDLQKASVSVTIKPSTQRKRRDTVASDSYILVDNNG